MPSQVFARLVLLLSLLLCGRAYAVEQVDINSADAATLDRVLLNVGASKAEAIVAYRKAHGAFRSPEQLALVHGIGLKTVEKNRDRIVIGDLAPARRPTAPSVGGGSLPRAANRR